MEQLYEETSKEPTSQDPNKGCKRRSSLLLNWLKDPRNQFMFLGNNSSSPVTDNMKKTEDRSIRDTSSPVSEPELLNGSSVHDSSDSDIWDVSSIETPTLVRKSSIKKKPRRKTTSFKSCKDTCDGTAKVKRRHTCGSTNREVLSALVPYNDHTNCHCGKGQTQDGQLMPEHCFDFRALNRNSLTDTDSGITEPSDIQKGTFPSTVDSDSPNTQLPLDGVARRNESGRLYRSKSECNIVSQSKFIYRDINVQTNDVTEYDVPRALTARSPTRKPLSLNLPRERKTSAKDGESLKEMNRTLSLFDLSGKDPSSEADFFFGIKEEELEKDLSVPLCESNMSKSCGDITADQETRSGTRLSRRVVIIPQNADRKSKESRQRVRSVPSLRVRALRRQYTNEGSVTGSKLSRVKLGSMRINDPSKKDDDKDGLTEMRERLKSVDINDLVNEENMDQVDDLGNTLLHYAAAQGDDKLIKSILGGGASVWKPNKFGHLPLDMVSSFRSAMFLSHSTLFYGHGSNMVRQGHLHAKCIHYEL